MKLLFLFFFTITPTSHADQIAPECEPILKTFEQIMELSFQIGQMQAQALAQSSTEKLDQDLAELARLETEYREKLYKLPIAYYNSGELRDIANYKKEQGMYSWRVAQLESSRNQLLKSRYSEKADRSRIIAENIYAGICQ